MGLVSSLARAVRNQNYESTYCLQAIPFVGFVVSMPTVLVSGVEAIYKYAQAVFQHFKNGAPWHSSTRIQTPLEDAIDLTWICLNNTLNVLTVGILNNVFVPYAFCIAAREYDRQMRDDLVY